MTAIERKQPIDDTDKENVIGFILDQVMAVKVPKLSDGNLFYYTVDTSRFPAMSQETRMEIVSELKMYGYSVKAFGHEFVFTFK